MRSHLAERAKVMLTEVRETPQVSLPRKESVGNVFSLRL